MTRDKWVNALAHGLAGLALQALLLTIVGWSAWASAAVVWALFYGREHSQEERKAADILGIKHGFLWRLRPKIFLKYLWPGCWTAGNYWGFILPFLLTGCVAIWVTW